MSGPLSTWTMLYEGYSLSLSPSLPLYHQEGIQHTQVVSLQNWLSWSGTFNLTCCIATQQMDQALQRLFSLSCCIAKRPRPFRFLLLAVCIRMPCSLVCRASTRAGPMPQCADQFAAHWFLGTCLGKGRQYEESFMPGRNTDRHVHKVMEIRSTGGQGAWVTIEFLEAYDKVGHAMVEGLLRCVGLEGPWMPMPIVSMKDELKGIATNKVSNAWILPEGETRQGGLLSAAIYVMIAALLCILIKKAIPSATTLLCVDGTLLWLPGGKEQVQPPLRELKRVVQEGPMARNWLRWLERE